MILHTPPGSNSLSYYRGAPVEWRIYGSHDEVTWYQVHSQEDHTFDTWVSIANTYPVTSYEFLNGVHYSSNDIFRDATYDSGYITQRGAYTHFRLVVNKSTSSWGFRIDRLHLHTVPILARSTVTDMTGLSTSTNGAFSNSIPKATTIEWFGYFKAPTTGTYTFSTGLSNDLSRVWIGPLALKGYSSSNYDIQSVGSATYDMVQDTVYPIRIQYSEANTGGGFYIGFTSPGGSLTYDWSGVLVTPSAYSSSDDGTLLKSIENPRMTSNSIVDTAHPTYTPWSGLGGWTASASSYLIYTNTVPYPPYAAFEKHVISSQSSAWIANGGFSTTTGEALQDTWLQLSLPVARALNTYTMRAPTMTSAWATRAPKEWTIQGSHDGTIFDIVHTVTNNIFSSQGQVKEYPVYTPQAYKYYRINITKNNINASWDDVIVQEWRLFLSETPFFHTPTSYMLLGTVNENPNLGSAVLQSGAGNEGPYELNNYIVQASSTYNSTDYKTVYAFNKVNSSTSNCWFSQNGSSLPQWLSITYPSAVNISSYAIESRYGYAINYASIYPPHTWILQGSNDNGVSWVDLDTKSRIGQVFLQGDDPVVFEVSSKVSYSMYRLYITESLYRNTTTINTQYVGIGQWRLFTTPNPGLGKAVARSALKTKQVPGQLRVPKQVPAQAVSSGEMVSMISVSRKDLIVNAAKTSITDSVTGQEWNFSTASVSLVLEDGVPCLDLTAGGLTLSGTGTTLGQQYTAVYYWKPVNNTGIWRTLHNNSPDYTAIIQQNTSNLGIYSDRDGGFRDTGFDISPVWQTLVVTGEGSGSSSLGTSTFYVNNVNVGTADRVASGTPLAWIGLDATHWPGHVAVAGIFNRVLSRKEIRKMHRLLKRWGVSRFKQQIPKKVARVAYLKDHTMVAMHVTSGTNADYNVSNWTPLLVDNASFFYAADRDTYIPNTYSKFLQNTVYVPQDGLYMVIANMCWNSDPAVTSNGPRVSVLSRLSVNGTYTIDQTRCGYLRSAALPDNYPRNFTSSTCFNTLMSLTQQNALQIMCIKGSGTRSNGVRLDPGLTHLILLPIQSSAFIKLKNVDTTTDFNTSQIQIPFNTVDQSVGTWTVSASGIQVATAGDYRISVNLSLYSAVGRANVVLRVRINGTNVPGASRCGYIRSADGHNDSSVHITTVCALQANDIIDITTQQEAASGVVKSSAYNSACIDLLGNNMSVASYSTDTTTNYALTTWTPVVWDTDSITSPWAQKVSSTTWRFVEKGYYSMHTTLSYVANQYRFSLKCRVQKNGTDFLSGEARQGYVRNASSHNSSSVHLSTGDYFNAGDEVQVVCALAEPESGVSVSISLINTESIWSIIKHS